MQVYLFKDICHPTMFSKYLKKIMGHFQIFFKKAVCQILDFFSVTR